jgi:hypothetical protein
MVTLAETAPAMLCKVGAKYVPLLRLQVLKMMMMTGNDKFHVTQIIPNNYLFRSHARFYSG